MSLAFALAPSATPSSLPSHSSSGSHATPLQRAPSASSTALAGGACFAAASAAGTRRAARVCRRACGGARRAPRRHVRAVAEKAPAVTEKKEAWKEYGLKWGVHKFGGASLNDAQLYKICGDLLLSESKTNAVSGQSVPTAAIVSAAGGMTDALVSIINTSLVSVEESCEKLKAAANRQKSILLELVPTHPDLTNPVIRNIEQDQDAVKAMLLAASKMRGVPPQMEELVAGLGEVWSAQTLSAYLKMTGANCEWKLCRE
ncbi:Bifunctional aspartokinase/homoserine dehydrogenase 2, partial [Durusdinium trenchii]